MSHQLQGPRAGLIKQGVRSTLHGQIDFEPDALSQLPHIDYIRDAGSEGIELVMWLIMRGALNAEVKPVHRFYHVPRRTRRSGI